ASAHIEAGDVLTAINGSRLVHAGEFARIISGDGARHNGLSRHLARPPGDAGQAGARLDPVRRVTPWSSDCRPRVSGDPVTKGPSMWHDRSRCYSQWRCLLGPR